MQKGRGGMGSHKHGISGHTAKFNKTKLLTSIVYNRLRRRRRMKPEMIDAREIRKVLDEN